MKQPVSKLRAKKSKSREKQASKAASEKRPVLEGPAISMLVAVILWLSTVVIIAMESFPMNLRTPEVLLPLSGDAVLLLVTLCMTGLFITILRPAYLKRNSRLVLLAVASLISTLVAKGILIVAITLLGIPHDVAVFFVPFALTAIIATILLDGAAGIAAGSWMAVVLSIMAGYRFPILICGIIGTVMSAALMQGVRSRSKVMKRALIIAVAQITCVFAATVEQWQHQEVSVVLHQAGACIFSGFASAIVALLILPLFERIFNITTDISLLELSDLSHPLLQRLAIEAPGTYHHSLLVANLASAAAEAIGANSLVTRVCAYFHDVGKLTKPEFFVENQRRDNPHDELPPSMSTLIITSHVKEGLSMAARHKLPNAVVKVIHEHHGNSLLSCFHHKAKNQLEFELDRSNSGNKNRLNEGDFRYQGPRPSTKESGIICIADSVEAASRALEKVTATHLENLVTEIMMRKIDDGQLDDCPLTFEELTSVRKSLVFSLTSMHHGRVPYPDDEDNSDQQTKATPGKPAGR